MINPFKRILNLEEIFEQSKWNIEGGIPFFKGKYEKNNSKSIHSCKDCTRITLCSLDNEKT